MRDIQNIRIHLRWRLMCKAGLNLLSKRCGDVGVRIHGCLNEVREGEVWFGKLVHQMRNVRIVAQGRKGGVQAAFYGAFWNSESL